MVKTTVRRLSRFSFLLFGCAFAVYFLNSYTSIARGGPYNSIYGAFKNATSVLHLSQYKSTSNTNRAHRCGPATAEGCKSIKQKAVFDPEVLYQTLKRTHYSLYSRKPGSKCVPRLPSCIIIGVKKSGTRELIDFMAMHPNIVIKRKPIYEVNYFLHPNSPLDWYRRQMPCSYPDQITVTKSPFYFYSPHVPSRLHTYNSTLKMIILVREPIARVMSGLSFSFIQQQIVKGLPRNESHMPEVDDAIVDHVTGSVKINHPEIQLSTYDTAMERYLKYFSRDQILIIETGEFKDDPAGVLNRVESFLGLEHFIIEDMFAYSSEKQFYCVRRRREDFNLSSPHAVDKMACYDDDRGRTKQKPLQPDTLRILKEYFDDHNENFFKLINKRFDW